MDTNNSKTNIRPHILAVDESIMEGNEDVRRIIMRLQSAALDPEVRRGMILEDMYLEELEKRNAEAMANNDESTKS